MKRASQLYLDPRLKPNKQGFGGTLLKKGHAKVARPISTKHSTHLALRSSKAKGSWSFLQPENRKAIEEIIYRFSDKYGVRIYSLSIAGNHIHGIIKLTKRGLWNAFIRGITAAIVMAVTKVNKLTELTKNFWDNRPWTRIVEWDRAFWVAKHYVIMNELESVGIIPHQLRGVALRPKLLMRIENTA